MLLIVFAVFFVVLLFFLKNKTAFKKEINQNEGLAYGNETIKDLVSKDTDEDGVLDWEEGLWGTDPTKKDTNDDGTSDGVEIEKLKAAQGKTMETTEDIANLTQTDKFSRELFATVATLNQAGTMDQATVDKLSSSLAEQMENSIPRKVFITSDIKVVNDDTLKAIQDYNNAMEGIYKKYPIKSVTNVLQEFLADGENVDISVLVELDPIISQMNKILNELVKVSTPLSLSSLHLNLINDFQRLMENISDIKLYDTDVIVALSGISQYEKNVTLLETTLSQFADIINKKLSN